MSLHDLYQDSKKDKKDSPDKVVYDTHTAGMKSDIETVSLSLQDLKNSVVQHTSDLRELQGLDSHHAIVER